MPLTSRDCILVKCQYTGQPVIESKKHRTYVLITIILLLETSVIVAYHCTRSGRCTSAFACGRWISKKIASSNSTHNGSAVQCHSLICFDVDEKPSGTTYNMVPSERALVSFYKPSIHITPLSSVVYAKFKVVLSGGSWPQISGKGRPYGIGDGTIRKSVCEFL